MNKTNYPGPSGRQKHHLPVTGMLTAILLMIAATGCTDYADTGNRLPEGKYPITFSAAVDGLTVTRATTTENTWTDGDKVAIKIGSDVKKYKVAPNGCLTLEDDQEPFYWTNQTMSVSAWYSSTYSDTKPATFSVQTEQQENDGYQKSDFLYAAQDIIFQSGGSSSMLTFKHLPVKVVVNLKYGDQVTEQEVSTATVSIVNQATTSGTIANDGTVAQVNPDNTSITPNVTPAPLGYQKSVQALLVPQQMKDKQFIKVSITTNGVERKYFYTPTGDNDANLTAGQQYTYNITVTKEGLQVEPVTASWKDSAEDGNVTEADTFKIHLASFTPPSNTSDFTVTGAGGATMTASDGVYTTTRNEISISLSAEENYRLKKFLPQVTGSCKLKGSYTVNTRTYTYTFYDIRSDLCLNVIAEAEAEAELGNPNVGDYYYVDGTWSSTWEKSCIGIVFKVGASGDDSVSKYNNNDNNHKLTGPIHGYVVALHDALTTAGNWGTRGIETTLANVTDSKETAYTGYSDTQTIISSYSNGNTWKDYQAFSAVVDYRSIVPAPDASSDWYLPSLAQLGDVYSALNSISIPLTTAGQGFTTSASTDYGWYWTSSEKNNKLDAWHVSFRDGSKGSNAKDGTNYDSGKRACYARAILTF